MRLFETSLRTKFIVVCTMVILACIALVITVDRSIRDMDEYGKIKEQLGVLETQILELRKHEKDFILRHDVAYHDKFKEVLQDIRSSSETFPKHMEHMGVSKEHVALLRSVYPLIDTYANAFEDMVEISVANGLDQDSGLRGKLRGAVHEAEAMLDKMGQVSLSRDMLMLRRHEKDFMLRHDLKYRDRFEKAFDTFMQSDALKSMDASSRQQVTALMKNYHDGFLQLVAGMEAEGLDENSGINGKMRNSIHQFEPIVVQIHNTMSKLIDQKKAALETEAMIIGGVATLLMVFFVLSISIDTDRKVKKITRTLETIIETHDLSVRIELNSSDEFGAVSNNINKLFEELRNLIEKTIAKARQVTELAKILAARSREIRQTSANISERSGVVSESAEEASQNFRTITSAVEEMSGNSNTIASSIEEMSSSLNEVAQNCQRELEIAAKAQEQSDHSKQMMSRLSSVIENITTVSDTIQAISEQTNLLALNATIEAASAGEAGKGFAVVANEVKELSKQTANAITNINSNVEEIQSVATDFIKTVEGIGSVIEDFNLISQTIVAAVEEQSVTMNEISKNVNEANAATNEISMNVTTTSDHVIEVTKSMVSVNDGVAETVQSIEQIDQQIEALDRLSHELDESVRHFKT